MKRILVVHHNDGSLHVSVTDTIRDADGNDIRETLPRPGTVDDFLDILTGDQADMAGQIATLTAQLGMAAALYTEIDTRLAAMRATEAASATTIADQAKRIGEMEQKAADADKAFEAERADLRNTIKAMGAALTAAKGETVDAGGADEPEGGSPG